MGKVKTLIDLIKKLEDEKHLEKNEWIRLITERNEKTTRFLSERAMYVCNNVFGKQVYLRGLIELTNYCKNDCYYCGIRKSNNCIQRYRLSKEEVMECCNSGYQYGLRTFVLQGGEDGFFTDEKMIDIISSINKKFPDCAITLSIGEKSYDTYKAFYDAGADRFLLRHETANNMHYSLLHPLTMSPENRKQCLYDLKEIGYQVGCGFMVGTPAQTVENLAEDMEFIYKLQPHMIGIGPFVPHHQTPFANEKGGTAELTLFMLGLLRLMIPNVLLPATTALGTIDEYGREKGLIMGANVIMPNLSPVSVRKKYELYDNKLCSGDEAAEHIKQLEERLGKYGYSVSTDRGDAPGFTRKKESIANLK